jgi:hypothetical protein
MNVANCSLTAFKNAMIRIQRLTKDIVKDFLAQAREEVYEV